jgi:hypothetical protein
MLRQSYILQIYHLDVIVTVLKLVTLSLQSLGCPPPGFFLQCPSKNQDRLNDCNEETDLGWTIRHVQI